MSPGRDPVYVQDTVERRYEVYSYWKESLSGYKGLAAVFAGMVGVVLMFVLLAFKGITPGKLFLVVSADVVFAVIVYFFEPLTLLFLFGFSVSLFGAPAYGLCWLFGVQPVGLRFVIASIAGVAFGAFMVYHYFDAKSNTAWSSRIDHESGQWR